MSRKLPGRFFEVGIRQGFAYGICTHVHEGYGPLVRIFRGVHERQMTSFPEAKANDVQFTCFYPLQAAVRERLVRLIDGAATVDAHLFAFPLFRVSGLGERWWLWDGEREVPVDALNELQRSLPIRGIWNHALLVSRIESGYE